MNGLVSISTLAAKAQAVTVGMAEGALKDLTMSEAMYNRLVIMIDDPDNKEAKSPYLLLEVIKLKEQMAVTKSKLVMDLTIALKGKSALASSQGEDYVRPMIDLSGIPIEERESLREGMPA